MTYSIRGWSDHFENAQSRKCVTLNWIRIGNQHDGKSFRRLMAKDNGPQIYGAWILLLQVASKCPVRGVLADEDGPLSAEDIAYKTGCPESVLADAMTVLTSKEIRWLETTENGSAIEQTGSAVVADCQSAAARLDDTGDREEKKREEKREVAAHPTRAAADSSDEFSLVADELVELWNATNLSKVRKLTPARKKSLRTRIEESDWRESWRGALARVANSSFCCGSGSQGWTADLDWFLRPDTLTKILEGKYDNSPNSGHASTQKAKEIMERHTAEVLALEQELHDPEKVAETRKQLEVQIARRKALGGDA